MDSFKEKESDCIYPVFLITFLLVAIGVGMHTHEMDKKMDRIKTLENLMASFTNNSNYPLEHIGIHEVTAYNSVESQTDNTPYLTASGYILDPKKDFKRVCAANHIPFHTKIYVENVGWMIVVDRMHPKNDGKIDIYWGNNIKGARKFGRQKLPVWKFQ